ncbi:MAG: VOC family protein [Planctomycetota bacterium]|nr:VOC family protein [Planctomycetota bacterium]MDG2144071.1 VOC family protein [Planctomycetota bacterium]
MTKPTVSLSGRIIWNEIHCTDFDATCKFYNKIFGWTTKTEERETYTHFYLGGKTVGGLMPIEPGSSVRPHWAVYVGTDDIEGYMQRAEAAGGKPKMPLLDLPETGKICAIADAEGAVLFALDPTDPTRPEWIADGSPGTFCWVEILCDDAPAAREFYSKVVGWDLIDMDMGKGAIYTVLAPKGSPEGFGVAGIQAKPVGDTTPSCWLPYIAVSDIEASTNQVVELGGTLQVPATEILGKGRFSIVTDPGGSPFAMYWSNPDKAC